MPVGAGRSHHQIADALDAPLIRDCSARPRVFLLNIYALHVASVAGGGCQHPERPSKLDLMAQSAMRARIFGSALRPWIFPRAPGRAAYGAVTALSLASLWLNSHSHHAGRHGRQYGLAHPVHGPVDSGNWFWLSCRVRCGHIVLRNTVFDVGLQCGRAQHGLLWILVHVRFQRSALPVVSHFYLAVI